MAVSTPLSEIQLETEPISDEVGDVRCDDLAKLRVFFSAKKMFHFKSQRRVEKRTFRFWVECENVGRKLLFFKMFLITSAMLGMFTCGLCLFLA